MTSASAPDQHIGWVDYARGLGILAVVVWHTAGGILRAGIAAPPAVTSVVSAWDAYAYRSMPVFFLVSGLFVVKSLRRTNRAFVATKARTLLYPYLLWSVLSLALGSIAGGAANNDLTLADLPQILYAPVLQYWFLPALFVVMVVYMLAYRYHVPTAVLVAAGVIAYVAAAASGWMNAVASSQYVIAQIGLFSIFFIIGGAYGPRLLDWLARASAVFLVAIVLGGAATTLVLIAGGPQPAPLGLPVVSAVGCLAATVCAAVLLSRWRLASFVQVWGRRSLEIYVAQVICAAATRIVLQRAFHVDGFGLLLVVCSAAGIYLPLLLAEIVDRWHWPFVFAWPEPMQAPHAPDRTASSAT